MTEPARDDDPVEMAELTVGEHPLDALGLDPLDLDLGTVMETGVLEALDDRQVGVGQLDVLADEPDLHGLGGGFDLVDDTLPRRQIDVAVDPQQVADEVVEPLVMEDQRQLVDVAGIGSVDDRVAVHVAHVRDLRLQVVGERLLGPAHDDVGLDAARPQFGDRVLCRLGLLLARRADERHEGDVDVADVVPSDEVAELADGLEERQDLDVADRAADFGDDHVDVLLGDALDASLDLVGDVRDHLDGLAQVVAAPFGGHDRLVDRTGGRVGVARQVLVDEPLVVAEVEVGLAAVVGDEHLAVFEWVHRARVDVDVRIELLERHPQAAELEQPPERRGRQTLTERAGNASRHENVLGHGTSVSVSRREITLARVDPELHASSSRA